MRQYAVIGTRQVISGLLLNAAEFPSPGACTMTRITARISAPNAAGDVLLDVRKNGVSIFALPADRPKIVAGQTTGYANATASLAAGDLIQVDVLSAPTGGVSGFYVTCWLDDVDVQRQQTVLTTASLANAASETGFISIGKSGWLFKVAADRACRVRLYATAAQRDSDAPRAEGVARSSTHDGLFFEGIFTAGVLSVFTQDPVVTYYNADGPVVDKLYYNVANNSGATHTVQVTFDYVRTET